MVSPRVVRGKQVQNLPSYSSDINQSRNAASSQTMPNIMGDAGLGNVAWRERVDGWKISKDKIDVPMSTGQATSERGASDIDAITDVLFLTRNDEARIPLSRKVAIPPSRINPYRVMILLQLISRCLFLHYRITNPVHSAFSLWLISVICEIWFSICWILDQFSKWFPVNRETYLDRLALIYDKEGEPLQLAAVDIFVCTVDPLKETPLGTANTILSILAVDYPVEKVSCYVYDDGASMLTFEALVETSQFARKWVPFTKKYAIEPRAPEWYFSKKINYLKDKVHPSFVKDRRAMKQEYEEFKIRINGLVAKATNIPEEHRGLIQVFLSQNGGLDTEGNELPRLVYVSREKRLGFQHHNKAGAMNALLRVSAILSNGPFLLNLDCDHYINNSKALKEAMCFLMDPNLGKNVCYVQFPQRFDGIDRNKVFFDINLRGLDGIQGPFYVGTGCIFNRRALYGYEPPIKPNHKRHGFGDEESLPMLQMIMEKRFGQSSIFVTSTLMENGGVPQFATLETLLKEAIHVMSCGYEYQSEWGSEIGWIYGSVTEDILTGLKMHARGWRSIYCMPKIAAFKGSAPNNLSNRLNQVLRLALGSLEILVSRHCPIWYAYSGRLKLLQRFSYVNTTIYPITSIPLLIYCTLPAVCLLTNKFIVPQISNIDSIRFIFFFLSIFATRILEMRWSGVGIYEWWRNEQFRVIGGVSAHLFAVLQGLLKLFATTSKASNVDGDSTELYMFKWTTLLIPPTTVVIINLVGVAAGISYATNGYQSWSLLFGKLLFAFWVIIHLSPFLKGLIGRQNRIPAIVVIWSIMFTSIFSFLWIIFNPFTTRFNGPKPEVCGIYCQREILR